MNKRIEKKRAKRRAKHLEKFIGKNIIRTKPVKDGDWSRTYGAPIKFLGIDKNGGIRYQHTGVEASIFKNEEFSLPSSFFDENWILFSDAVKPQKRNPLNKHIGRLIKRTCPVELKPGCYMLSIGYGVPVTLIAASATHIYIQYNDSEDGRRGLLDSRCAKPEEWELA